MLPLGDRCSAGVDGKEKSTGDGGGAGVSLTSEERDVRVVEALKAALTSWPRVEFVRMERRWRGLKAEADILMFGNVEVVVVKVTVSTE